MRKKSKILKIAAIFLTAITIFNFACKKDKTDPLVATSIELVSGNNQTGYTVTALTNSVVILVKDQNGNTFAGTEVSFTVSEGSVSAVTAATDSVGKANIIWKLGSGIGTQTLVITAFEADGTTDLAGSPLEVNATAAPTNVTDIDGNIYPVVVIGNQLWMAKNLEVTHYASGIAIPKITDQTSWQNLSNNPDDAYCFYNFNDNSEYGALYTWIAAMGDNTVASSSNPSGVQGVCPDGWHLPSDAEWIELFDYLGGEENNADGKIRETGTIYWASPNFGATNESGFTALAGGYINFNGSFGLKECGYWWVSDDYSIIIVYRTGYFFSRWGSTGGSSVRCVMD